MALIVLRFRENPKNSQALNWRHFFVDNNNRGKFTSIRHKYEELFNRNRLNN